MKKIPAGRAPASATTNPATDRPDDSRTGASFPIVGIGASAGGLEAFTALLTHLPIDTGMGFVLVQHLDPQHESALTQLLSRATTMPVQEVTDKLAVEANHVYVIPRNTTLGIVGGVLTLRRRPTTRAPHRSIDVFLEALAADQRELAIGVILSGTASDGTVGLEAIKAEGGIAFAQDDSARYDSMPRSAVAAGCVDFVLSPEQIAYELARIAKHPQLAKAAAERSTRAEDDRVSATAHEGDDTPLPSGGHDDSDTGATRARAEAGRERVENAGKRIAEDGFKKILLLLRNHSGVDFSLYKSSTIQRRITRRLVLSKHDTLERYAQFLRGNTHELDALYSDVLISVTSFFRNPDAFDMLQRKVLPALLQRSDDPLRMWVLGCSTGQEAYSLAMSFVEAAEKTPRMRTLQVFATDLNDALLDKARQGLYAKSIAQDLSPGRLRRFFVEEEGGYRVNKALREMVVFARQNMISDPPFSRMDLISCRNLLIYLEPGLQKKVFPVFHYALKPGGFLYLGASESVGSFIALFEPVDKKHKIYVKKAAPTPAFQLPARKQRGEADTRHTGRPVRTPAEPGVALEGFRAELSAQREADRVSVNQFAPPAVLVNADLQILQFRGPTSAYLEPPTGKASFDVLKMARNGLMLPLRTAINRAKKDNKTIRTENLRVERDGTIRTVNVQVIPLKNLRDRCFLIVFEDADPQDRATTATQEPHGTQRASRTPKAQRDQRAARVGESRRIAELETELAETREYLQSIQEQHEAANEELQASNEEVQSANEELQSINEELETSKEELESANEELTTVNAEMANRNVELNRLNSDLVNIQTSAQVAMVLLSRNLIIRRFSAQAEKQFNLLAADIGRSIGSVRHGLDVPDLHDLITDVIDTVRVREREVRDTEGCWFSLRVRPYLTTDNKVDGAVLVLVDITDLKRSELTIAAARDYADAIVRTTRDPLVILDGDLRVDTANAAFYRTFEVSPSESEGHLLYELGNQQWNIPQLRELLEAVLQGEPVFDDFEVTHHFEHLGRRTMRLNGRRLDDSTGQPARILLGIQDVTESVRSQAVLRQATVDLSEADRHKNEFLAMLAHELRNPLAPILGALEIMRRAKRSEGSDEDAVDVSHHVDDALDMLQRQIGHMVRLVDDLLDASRISRGKIDLRREHVELSSVVHHAVDAARPLAERRGQELRVTLPRVPLYVNADPTRMAQIVGNLLNNACKFTERGGHIWLTVERADEPGPAGTESASQLLAPQVVIRVRDTGIGIAADRIEAIFDMFTQLDTSLERSTSGLGIGLTLVRALAEMHGGTVEASSSGIGQGSELVVRLPIVIEEATPAPQASMPGPAATPLRILVVDDNRDGAESLALLLTLTGHETHTAHDGLAALESAARLDPDVILLDIGLPGLNGYEVARRIREQHRDNGRPILVALTGWGQDEDRKRAAEAGFDAHVVKPVDFVVLGKVLAELSVGTREVDH